MRYACSLMKAVLDNKKHQEDSISFAFTFCNSFYCFADPEDAYSQDWIPEQYDKRLSEFLGGPGKRLSEFLGGPGKRVSEFLGGPGKRVSEFLGGPGKRVSEFLGGPGKRVSEFLGGPGKRQVPGNLHVMHENESKRVSEFLGGPGKRSQQYYDMENSKRR